MREGEAAPAVEPAALVPVYLANGTRTSGGTGPGVVQVPPGEAAALVRDRLAVYGGQPPYGSHATGR